MRKQDRIQQQKNQDPSRQQREQQSPPQSNEQVKGTADAQPSRPPRKPGEPLPIPD